jgi:hypothetical protein
MVKIFSPFSLNRKQVHFRLLCLMLSGCALILFISSCLKTAGTTTGTDNPEIAVSFIDGDSPKAVTGQLSIYHPDQNTAVNPDPLLSYFVNASESCSIPKEDLEALTVSDPVLVKKSSGSLAFNLVLEAGEIGGIIRGLTYEAQTRQLYMEESEIENALEFPVGALGSSDGIIEGLPAGEVSFYLYVPGTPYVSAVQQEGYTLVSLPEEQFIAMVITDQGNIYGFTDSIAPGDSMVMRIHSREGNIPPDSVPQDTVLRLMSTISLPVLYDTVFSSIWISELCDLADHPHSLMYMHGASIIDIQGQDTVWEYSQDAVTWAQLLLHELLSSKKILFSSYFIDSVWVTSTRTEEQHEKTSCNIHKEPNPYVRLDSAYFLKENSWELEYQLYFTGLEIDTIGVNGIVTDSTGPIDTVLIYSLPPEFLSPEMDDTLHINTWRQGDQAWSDTTWYP